MTNRDLAKLLGVSPATLSLVINNKPGISEKTRQSVIKKLEELGYSALIKPSSSLHADKNICFIVYKRHGKILDFHPFFLLILESIEACAHKYDFDMIFLSIDRRCSVDEPIQRINKLSAMNCRGAILFATEMLEDDISLFSSLKIPCVVLDNYFPRLDIDSVTINNQLGTYQAVKYLVQMRHSAIGYLQSNVYINSFGEREQGYREALSLFGLGLDPRFVFKLDYTEEGSYQDMRKLLASGIRLPTAFVSDDDTIAMGAMRAFHEAGLNVPDDISVIGFNDRPAYSNSIPTLTSVYVPKYSFGASAVELLVKRIYDEDSHKDDVCPFTLRIGTKLISRNSVRPIL